MFKDKKSQYIEYFLILCIMIGIVLHIIPYLFHGSLWVDEAMLVSSVCTRSLLNLTASPLDWGQSAPIGYLYIVKILTIIWGSSTTVLRIWSLFTSLGCIGMVYLLLKDAVRKRYALLFTAIFALTDRFIYYGHEAKPYMSDNFCCLVVLFLWKKYKNNNLTLLKLALAYAVLIWFSFSAVFFIAACMILECFHIFGKLLRDKHNRGVYVSALWKCAIVLISFILNYFLWLAKTSDNAGGAGYWDLLKFPLIPQSLSDFVLIYKMAKQFLNFYTKYTAILICCLFVIYLHYSIQKKTDLSKILVPFLLAILLLFVASYCGFYPIKDRLVQIYSIILLIFAAHAGDFLEYTFVRNNYKRSCIYIGILTVTLAVSGMSGCKNLFARHVYHSGSEVAASMKYLKDNMTSDDTIYIFRSSIPVYTYETGYETSYQELNQLPNDKNDSSDLLHALPYKKGSTIYGQTLVAYDYEIPYSYEYEINASAIEEDSALISACDSVYIFTSHGEAGIPALLNKIKEYGTVDVVCESYNTRLYHFTNTKTQYSNF